MEYLIIKENTGIRKMQDSLTDYNFMAKWLSDKEVLNYYGGRDNPFDLDRIIEKYSPRIKGEDIVVACFIEAFGKPIGYIQYYPIDLDEYKAENFINMESYTSPYGIDLFIGETDYWNKGFGTKSLIAMLEYLFKKEKADIIFIDPQTWNKRAIRCYEKSGFTPIRIIEKRELFNGEYKDSLIMAISNKVWNANISLRT